MLLFPIWKDDQFMVCVGVETNECLENYGGCWHDVKGNITACKVRVFYLIAFSLMSSFNLVHNVSISCVTY